MPSGFLFSLSGRKRKIMQTFPENCYEKISQELIFLLKKRYVKIETVKNILIYFIFCDILIL